MLQYGFERELKSSDISAIRDTLTKAGIENPVIQIEQAGENLKHENSPEAKASELQKGSDKTNIKTIVSIRTKFLDSSTSNNETAKLNADAARIFRKFYPLQVSAIGPTLGAELFRNAVAALLLAFIAIVAYLTIRFKLDYAMFALVALFHDALFVCGVFSILGLFFNVEIDSLFITAILTVIGFSVHDTIVVFDRIRENSRFLAKKMSFNDIVNASVNQTLARSINTSLTALVTLLALYFLGGATTKNFVLAMILGIGIGTYSSIFNASALLAMWRSYKVKSA
ncbi:MAG: protein translocase subunit SecF [Bacillus subtilis]|nr:protein translocase subunit SecF [Bacillus subtilis]